MNIGLKPGVNSLNIGFGSEVAIEQVDLLFRKNLSLFFSKTVGRQVFDESMGIKCDSFTHESILVRGAIARNTFVNNTV